MQELVGRLSTLDPEASETLKVVSYFDALVAAGVGVDGLLRGAAALAGTVAGVEIHGRVRRRAPSGDPADDEDALRSPLRVFRLGSAWIERQGQPHANDEMVVERLALAVELVESRRTPEGALEIAIDAGRSAEDRAGSLARMRLVDSAPVRVIATPADGPPVPGSTLVATRFGLVRVALDDGGAPPERAGIGVRARADHLPGSWESALVALRLTTESEPVVDAADLGILLSLALGFDPSAPPDDVVALSRLDERSRGALAALVEADSVRAAATSWGVHHSTMQARYESLTRDLGFDPRSPLGRARLVAAELLVRLMPRG